MCEKICNHTYYDANDYIYDCIIGVPFNAAFFDDTDIPICNICGKILTNDEVDKKREYQDRTIMILEYLCYTKTLQIQYVKFTLNEFKTDLVAFNVLFNGHLEYEAVKECDEDKLINEFVINGYINCNEIKDSFESFCYNNPIEDE